MPDRAIPPIPRKMLCQAYYNVLKDMGTTFGGLKSEISMILSEMQA